jgi:ADP-ribose pyrophosphatase YjhB (NUDIX family)
MRYRYCPRCATALEAQDRSDGQTLPVCPACGFVAYRNSKPTAGAVVVRDGKVLLAKRAIEPHKGAWDIPGGFLHHGEHPEEGIVRELREETGLEIRPVRLIGIYIDVYGDEGPTDDPDAILNIYYEAEIISGDPAPTDDVAELAWFPPDGLPGTYAFAHTGQVLEDWRRGRDAWRSTECCVPSTLAHASRVTRYAS